MRRVRVQSVWRLLSLPCESASRLASEALDRELTFLERWALRSHHFTCLACRRYARQVEFVSRAMRHFVRGIGQRDGAPGPRLPADVRARIEKMLNDG